MPSWTDRVLCVPLSTHSQTQTDRHTRRQAGTRADRHTRRHARTHTHTHTHSHIRTFTHTGARARTHTHAERERERERDAETRHHRHRHNATATTLFHPPHPCWEFHRRSNLRSDVYCGSDAVAWQPTATIHIFTSCGFFALALTLLALPRCLQRRYRAQSPCYVMPHTYRSHPDVKISDHRPVSGPLSRFIRCLV